MTFLSSIMFHPRKGSTRRRPFFYLWCNNIQVFFIILYLYETNRLRITLYYNNRHKDISTHGGQKSCRNAWPERNYAIFMIHNLFSYVLNHGQRKLSNRNSGIMPHTRCNNSGQYAFRTASNPISFLSAHQAFGGYRPFPL